MNLMSYFLLIAFLIGVVGGVGWFQVKELDRIAAEVEEEAIQVIDFEELRISLFLQYAELDDYMETKNPRSKDL